MQLQFTGTSTKVLGQDIKNGDTITVTEAQGHMLKGKGQWKTITEAVNKAAPETNKLYKKSSSNFRMK